MAGSLTTELATRTEIVHVPGAGASLVPIHIVVQIDAATHPELIEQGIAGRLNIVEIGERRVAQQLAVPVLVHEPGRALTLVVPWELCHTEVQERAKLANRIATWTEALPSYARAPSVVIGWESLSQQKSAGDRTVVQSGAVDPSSPRPIGHDDPTGPFEIDRHLSDMSQSDLLLVLADRDRRLEAALELVHRRDAETIPAIFAAIRRMTRGEAVRLLPAVVAFGDLSVPLLIAELGSKKAYVRHGAALALAALRSEIALESLTDLLLREPTEIWRELARGLGEFGASAAYTLSRRVATATEGDRDRIAWALSYVAVRAGEGPIDSLAANRNAAVARCARLALARRDDAAAIDRAVRGSTNSEHTVNRAFSQRFFELLEAPIHTGELSSFAAASHVIIPSGGQGAIPSLDTVAAWVSSPGELKSARSDDRTIISSAHPPSIANSTISSDGTPNILTSAHDLSDEWTLDENDIVFAGDEDGGGGANSAVHGN